MKNLFNTIQMKRPNNNVFDLSHDVKLSCNLGQLIPTLAMDCVPGDKFNIGCESLLRFAPLVSPVMHRMDVSMHYFFVPKRLLWPNWENYITNTKIGSPTPALPAFPTWLITPDTGYSQLLDYLGIPRPILAGDSEIISAMPMAAYQMIYNEYFRDQNLINPVDFALIDGDNTANTDLPTLRIRAWEHDYFTSSLPFAQKGDPVTLPLAGFQDVPVFANDNSFTPPALGWSATDGSGPVSPAIPVLTPDPDEIGLGQIVAKTSDLQGTSTTINELRTAFRLQEWLEKAARAGSRYIESILAHFGVRSSDKRLQRPEYITGTKSPVTISEVLQTSESIDESTPQGNMAGHAISVTAGKYGYYQCEEHGYIIGVMSIMPKTAYQQGIPKHFLKINDPFENFFPEFAHIGEQEVQNREIFAFSAGGDDTFGYVPRYAEYKFESSRVAGDFRTSLNFWHYGRIFETPPALNQAFVECDPGARIFAVTTPEVQKLYCHVLHKIRAVRPMPKFGTPTF